MQSTKKNKFRNPKKTFEKMPVTLRTRKSIADKENIDPDPALTEKINQKFENLKKSNTTAISTPVKKIRQPLGNLSLTDLEQQGRNVGYENIGNTASESIHFSKKTSSRVENRPKITPKISKKSVSTSKSISHSASLTGASKNSKNSDPPKNKPKIICNQEIFDFNLSVKKSSSKKVLSEAPKSKNQPNQASIKRQERKRKLEELQKDDQILSIDSLFQSIEEDNLKYQADRARKLEKIAAHFTTPKKKTLKIDPSGDQLKATPKEGTKSKKSKLNGTKNSENRKLFQKLSRHQQPQNSTPAAPISTSKKASKSVTFADEINPDGDTEADENKENRSASFNASLVSLSKSSINESSFENRSDASIPVGYDANSSILKPNKELKSTVVTAEEWEKEWGDLDPEELMVEIVEAATE